MKPNHSYVFTYNNPEPEWDPEKIWEADLARPAPKLRYLAGQFEIGDSGTRHFQGYVVCCNPQGLPGVRRLLQAPTAHYEPRKGTHEQALAYVHKEATRAEGSRSYVFGDPPQQGVRSDLIDLYDSISEGATERDIVEGFFGTYVKYHSGIRRALSVLAPGRSEYSPPEAYYFYGPAGTGKSTAAWHFNAIPWSAIYPVPLSAGSTVWFDGYDPRVHQLMILDDFYSTFKFHFLLKLLDGYPLHLPVKGGFIQASPKYVIITSNVGLDQQYPTIPSRQSLWRRFKRVVCCCRDVWTVERSPHSD